MSNDYVIVVTARKGSERLPRKNTLPIGGVSLTMRAVIDGLATGYPVVLSTDIEALKVAGKLAGAIVVDRPTELATADCSHQDAIEHAVREVNMTDHHVVLLQPTSPFRFSNVVNVCIDKHKEDPTKTVATTREIHDWFVGAENNGLKEQIVGCVLIYQAGNICDYSNVVGVKTHELNYMEINTEADYIAACKLSLQIQNIGCPVAHQFLMRCIRGLHNACITGPCTLVARGDSLRIRQDIPVVYLNHCRGYDGGRVDAIVIVANENLLANVNAELIECIDKCKFAIIRDHGSMDKVLKRFPELKNKYAPIESIPDAIISTITTGSITQAILATAGCEVVRVGFDGPVTRASKLDMRSLHYKGISYDVAILETFGSDRRG